MTIILIIGAFQALFFAALLIVKKRRTLCDSVMSFWLILLFLHLLVIYCKHLGLYEDYPHLIGSTQSLIFIYGPMLYFYVDNYISNLPGFRKKYFYHLIPFIVYNLYLLPFYLQSGNDKLASMSNENPPGDWPDVIFYLLKVIVIPFYVLLILFTLRKHKNNLQYYFSNFEHRDLMWVRYLVGSIAVIGVLVIFTGIAKMGSNSILTADSEQFVLAATSIWIFGLGFYAVKQTSIFVDVTYDLQRPVAGPSEATKTYRTGRLKKLEEDNFQDRLNQYLDKDKPYLKSRLTIDQLAEALEVSTHELSLYLNEALNQSFFDLINKHRVEEFIRRMQDPANANYTLLGIAMDCGFNSKASLNRIFKKYTGKSPSEYYKGIKSTP